MVGKLSICCFVAIEKRHIAAALLLCPEDGTGAVQLSVVLSLAGNNGCTNGCTTADKHKNNQQSRVACVAGLRNGVLRCGCCSRCRSGRGSRSRGGLSSSFGPSEIFLFLVLVKATVTVSLFTMLPLALEDAVV